MDERRRGRKRQKRASTSTEGLELISCRQPQLILRPLGPGKNFLSTVPCFLFANVFTSFEYIYAEVSSIEWEVVKMTEQESDLIYRMHKLVGNRWDLIAGRIPGRKPEEVERFWVMRHGDPFADKRNEA